MSSFDRFIQLPENRSAYEAVARLASAKKFPLLVIHGPPGSGKSQLVGALAVHFGQEDSSRTISIVASAVLGRDLLQPALDRRDASKIAIAPDLLVIEDLQHLPSRVGNTVAHILDRRQRSRLTTVITSGRSPADLDISPRLASRVTGGLVVAIQPLSESSRRQLASELCRERKLLVADNVIVWLARDPGGARPMLGAIAQLEALAKRHPPPLTLALITSELKVQIDETSPLDRLVARVASRFQKDVRAVRGPSRQRDIAWSRQIAMYVARQAGYSFPQIGAYFGGRDHTTVMHSCDKVARVAAIDNSLAQELRDLLAETPQG